MLIVQGNPVSQGIAVGEVFRYVPFHPAVEAKIISEPDRERNVEDYEKIRSKAERELSAIMEKISKSDPQKGKIFQAHIDILFDEAMNEDIYDFIRNDLYSPEYAVNSVYDNYIQILSKAKDPLIRERSADLKDVKNRLLRLWFQIPDQTLSNLDRPVIVVAHDLFPSDTATLKRENVLAILTEAGGTTSHTAILAKSYGIPAILGLPDLMQTVKQSETVIVDAVEGRVITEPTRAEIEKLST